MVLIDKFKNLPKEKKIAFSVFLGIVIIAFIAFIIMMARSGYLATSMRLLRVEGTVSIEDSKGGVKPVIDNIRFQSGDALSTGSDGIASVGLDDTKVITLENDSRAEFLKRAKQIELKLTKGGLYFEVTEHLDDDETYEIKTSNMTVGIRGTSGYVYYDESGLESIVVTDGVVVITATNPATGEVKTVEIHGGQEAKVFLYSDKASGDSVRFAVKDITEEDLDEFPLSMIVENKDLMKRICEFNNWDEEKLISLYNGIMNAIANGEQVELTPTPTTTSTPTPAPTVSGTPTPTVTPAPTDEPEPEGGNGGGNGGGDEGGNDGGGNPDPTEPSPTPEPAPVEYTVSFNANGHGTAPDSQKVVKGNKATEPAAPSESGYSFEGWYTDAACTTAYSFDTAVTADITLYALWEEESTEPEPMSGCEVLSSAWGKEYDGHMVYICYDPVSGGEYVFYGYMEDTGRWTELMYECRVNSEGYAVGNVEFYAGDPVYYSATFEAGELRIGEPDPDASYPSNWTN